MAKKFPKSRAERLEQTQLGKRLSRNTAVRNFCAQVERQLREAAREDVEAMERSERLTKDDYAVVINARDDHFFKCDE